MPVPTKPNEQRLRRDSDFTWEQFAKDCLLNKYVLVVGNEAVLSRNVNPEAEGDSLKLLLGLTIQELTQSNAYPTTGSTFARVSTTSSSCTIQKIPSKKLCSMPSATTISTHNSMLRLNRR